MATVKLILTIIQVLGAVFLTFVVLAQSGKSAGLSGAIAGGADTFLSKNKAKSWDAKLARWTKWVAIAFMIITLVLVLIQGTRFFYFAFSLKISVFPCFVRPPYG